MAKSVDPRSVARAVALQSLFAADVRTRVHTEGLTRRPVPDYEWLDEEFDRHTMEFADRLHRGVSDHRHGLDGLIGHFAPAWPVTQLPIVDRNILRIAIFELLHNPATPRKAAIDEAVELAKVFGSDSSARFVNGVLGSVMSSLESGELAAAGAAPDGR
jgi:N utilization substance protein B